MPLNESRFVEDESGHLGFKKTFFLPAPNTKMWKRNQFSIRYISYFFTNLYYSIGIRWSRFYLFIYLFCGGGRISFSTRLMHCVNRIVASLGGRWRPHHETQHRGAGCEGDKQEGLLLGLPGCWRLHRLGVCASFLQNLPADYSQSGNLPGHSDRGWHFVLSGG